MQSLPSALAALAPYRQFIVYKLVPRADQPGKTDKFPIDARTGQMPQKGQGGAAIWTDVNTALSAVNSLGTGYGLGFHFAASDPFFFLDIDNCLVTYNDGRSPEWSELARGLLNALPGAAVEISQSGRGLHIIGTGTIPSHSCKNVALGLELYHEDRFVALTGTGATGNAGQDMSYVLPWLVDNYFPPSAADGLMIGWSDAPVPEWNGPSDDTRLIERAMRSSSAGAAFGNRASFADLWQANTPVLAMAYPSDTDEYDRSSADAAIAQHLAFWTGKDCERVLRLMRGSALVREKWEREDYIYNTISKACAMQVDVLSDKVVESPITATVATVENGSDLATVSAESQLVSGSTYVGIEDQIRLFKGCVYVRDRHSVLIPGGHMIKPEQFRVAFGGYTWPMDYANERTSRNAWECFTESQAIRTPKADSSCFRPELPPGEIVHSGGLSQVNIYWPVETPRLQGDLTPFMTHLRKLLPNERDQVILLSYMAACVQHKGRKFQWAPLIQGVEGNGKTLFTRCVAFAIGQRYTHWPKASQVAKNFNAWMYGMLFIGVEDVYVPNSQEDILEELKPMITNDRLEIEKKGVDQITLGVCCNFMMNCNNKAALRKTANDRRLGPFYTAQQSKEDLERDGMRGEYFPKLYDWLNNGGYEIVNEFLHTYKIPDEFNPAHGHIAPITSSTDEAISHGLGRAEQEIREAIEMELSGFRGGWVSSMALDKLLEEKNLANRIPPNKRRDLMINLGYDWHPSLQQGRVNNSILPDSGKPRLFIRKSDVTLRAITTPVEVAKAYTQAQAIGFGSIH